MPGSVVNLTVISCQLNVKQSLAVDNHLFLILHSPKHNKCAVTSSTKGHPLFSSPTYVSRSSIQYTDVLTSLQLLTRPAHSIINQAFDSRLRVDLRRPINGDGFGVGAIWGLPIKSRQ